MKCALSLFAAVWLSVSATAFEPVKDVPADFKVSAPQSPAKSLASMSVKNGLRVELVAAEPLVMDPVNLDFGPDGKLWVVEMGDYPDGVDGKGKPGGCVRFLTDSNGDGRYDRSTVFLDGLNFPTTVKVWRDGVLIVAAPDIFFARDTNGDGKADKREVLFTGFGTGNQQHRVNGLVWGLDNYLHVANGDSGGTIKSLKTGKTLKLGSFDLKIRPDTGEMRLTTGRTQFGRVRDDLGNWFGCNNSKPLWHVVLDNETMQRNPHVRYPSAIRHVPAQPNAPRIYPAGTPALRYNNPFSDRHITSACGISLMRDKRLGSAYADSAFVCEPVHNLVHRQVLTRDGASFNSRRAADEAESEFLASTDQWFRPVTTVTGPDGALWVVDMYRYVIEHPKWIPKEWQNVLDLRVGDDLGRIYRVVSDKTGPVMPEKLADLPTAQLVSKLSSANGWTRDMAHQLLLWRKPAATAPAIMNGWNDDVPPLGKVHLLSLIDGLGGVPNVLVHDALTSANAALQAHALRFVQADANPAVIGEIAKLTRSDDPALRFRALIALGELKAEPTNGSMARAREEAGRALAQAAMVDNTSAYHRAALLSSLPPHLPVVADTLAAKGWEGSALLESLFETAVGAGDHASTAQLLRIRPLPHTTVFFLNAIDRHGVDLNTYRQRATPALRSAIDAAMATIAKARLRVADTSLSAAERIAAMAVLGRSLDQRKKDAQLLQNVLVTSPSKDLATAAARRLGEWQQYQQLSAAWPRVTPDVRSTVMTQFLARDDGCRHLLKQIQSGDIALQTIDATARQRLLAHGQKEIREQSKKLFGQASDASRQAVLDRFRNVASLKGDKERGRAHFQQLCAACHQLDGIGVNLGADLRTLTDRSTRAMLTAILDPNQAVEDKYQLYTVSLSDGSTLAGMIRSESSNAVELQALDGSRRQLLRSQIKALQNTGRSAMPEGLEASLDAQKLADIIAFVKGRDGVTTPYQGARHTIPGTIEAENFDDGAAGVAYVDTDAANQGKVYRQTQVDIEKFPPASNGHRLGWTKGGEWMVYTVEVTEPGVYDVSIPVSSQKQGGVFHLEIGGKDITGPIRIPDTGKWQTVQTVSCSTTPLKKGTQQLKLMMDSNGASSWVGDIDSFTFVKAATAGATAADAPRQTLNVGVARIDITPTEAVPLSGFYRRNQPISEVKQKLWAKALAFDDANGKPAVIVTVDVLGVPDRFRADVIARLPEGIGLDASQLTISASHTHTAPQIRGVAKYIDADYDAHEAIITRYADGLLDHVADAVKAALANRQPSHVDWTEGRVSFGVNRRMLDGNGKWRGFGKNPDGPVDHALPMLRVADTDGKARAVYVNYACHCTTLMQAEYVHGDWAGDAQVAIEKAVPGAVGLVSIGCGADVGPNNHGKGNLAAAKANGDLIGAEVARLVAKPMTPLNRPPALAETVINIPYDPLPSAAEWRGLATGKGARGAHARDVLKLIDAGGTVEGSFPYPIQSWAFGDDLAMVFLPGEVVIDYAVRLKTELDGKRLWVSSYSNGSPGYIPSKRLYAEGGYEVDSSRYFYGQPSRLSITTEDLIIDWVKRQVPGAYHSE
jgi:putative membrane-bound dehydrogenase-like protein